MKIAFFSRHGRPDMQTRISLMGSRRTLLTLALCILFAIPHVSCSALESDSEWDKGNDVFYQLLLVQLASVYVEPSVRFYNDTGTAEQYSLFPDASCSQSRIATFATTNAGSYTAYYQVGSFYLDINGTECLSEQFDFGRPSTAIQRTVIDCNVNTTRVQCNDAQVTTRNR